MTDLEIYSIIPIWKTHPKHTGYEVSSCGMVRSKDKLVNHGYGGKALKKARILSQYTTKRGYVNVGLTINKKVKTCRVHRLVAETWIENINNKPYINHKDLDKSNNHYTNLEWCTQQENITHYYKNR